MPNLRDIKKRIISVESTKQITRTMEMVATAKIRRATERILAATPYAKAIVDVLQTIAANLSQGKAESALLQRHEAVKTVAIIVIASDKGLAGGFNTYVLREADKRAVALEAQGKQVVIITAGKKALPYFNYRGREVALSFKEHSADPIIAEAREAASYIINGYIAGEIDEVQLVYNHAKNVADQVLTVEQILPIEKIAEHTLEDDAEMSEYTDEASKAAAHLAKKAVQAASKTTSSVSIAGKLYGDFDFEPSAEAVLDVLLPQYVETSIFHAMLDSAAGEQGARRKAMKSATDNATEMITTLSRIYNRARQGAITTEITEIVGGAAALEEVA